MVRAPRLEIAAWSAAVAIAAVAALASAPAPLWAAEPAAVTIHGGFPGLAADRWMWVRFDLHNSGASPRSARISVRRAGGQPLSRELVVAPLQRRSVVEYVYEGGPAPLEGASASLGDQSATWERSTGFPARLPVVAVTEDPGRVLPIEGLLALQEGVGVSTVSPRALPDRFMGWRGVAAVVVWADELPAPTSAEGRALHGYLDTGGTVLMYGQGSGEALFAGVSDGEVEGRRGALFHMGRGRTSLPDIRASHAIPQDAPLLPAYATEVPLDWIVRRSALYVAAALLALLLLRRSLGAGLVAAALAALLAVAAPLPPTDADVRVATWHGSDSFRQELQLLPGRTGRLVVPVALATDTVVVALDSTQELALEASDAGFSVHGDWGQPVRLLVEGVARALPMDGP